MKEQTDPRPQQDTRQPCIACREPVHPLADICPHCGTEQRPPPGLWRRFGTVLKWVGGITAILSLIASSIQLNGLWQTARETSRTLEDLLRASEIQQQVGQFQAALELVHQALELEPGSSAANQRQTEIAMALIRQYHGFSGLGHGDEVTPLLKILYRGSGQRDPQARADVLAHIAWATLLVSTSSQEMPTVRTYLEQALTIDPENTYAHLFWGTWCLIDARNTGCSEPIKDAIAHFKRAEATGEHQPFVSDAVIRALRLTHVDGAFSLLVSRIAGQLRSGGRPSIDRDRLFLEFGELSFYGPDDPLHNLLQHVAPKDALRVLRWAADQRGPERANWTQLTVLAALQELSGEREPALAGFRQIRARIRHEELTKGQLGYSKTRDRIDWELVRMLGLNPGRLGIEQQQVPAALRERLGLGEDEGILVSAVDGTAAESGLQVNDIIVGLNGASLSTPYYQDILCGLEAARAGDPVSLKIYRNGGRLNLRLRLGERDMVNYTPPHDNRSALHSPLARLVDHVLYGTRSIELQPGEWVVVEPQPLLRDIYGLPEGRLTGVLVFDRRSHSRDDALRAGDLIVDVADQPVTGIDQLVGQLKAAAQDPDGIFIRVWRNGRIASLLLTP